ncbi:hypothetical protein OCA26_15280 [Bacillus cereus]|uniref:hypothetical protein n=1 Tax=Bacillus sp. BB56-3 TaxID=2217831 RepID=UPI001C556654|nr:hypothetical protein [Bacillus sp. BB56-3]MCU4757478.1 hypothetical protein [Bacillus cereus]
MYKNIYNDFYTYYFKLINLENRYKLAVCSEKEDINNIEIVTIDKLKNIFLKEKTTELIGSSVKLFYSSTT